MLHYGASMSEEPTAVTRLASFKSPSRSIGYQEFGHPPSQTRYRMATGHVPIEQGEWKRYGDKYWPFDQYML